MSRPKINASARNAPTDGMEASDKKHKTAGNSSRGAKKKTKRPIAKNPAGQSKGSQGAPRHFFRRYAGIDPSKSDCGVGVIEAYFMHEGLGWCYQSSTHFKDCDNKVKEIFAYFNEALEGLPTHVWYEQTSFGFQNGRDTVNHVGGGVAFVARLAAEGTTTYKIGPTQWRSVLNKISEERNWPVLFKSKEDSVVAANWLMQSETNDYNVTNHNEAEALLIALAGAYKDYNEWKESK